MDDQVDTKTRLGMNLLICNELVYSSKDCRLYAKLLRHGNSLDVSLSSRMILNHLPFRVFNYNYRKLMQNE